MIEPLGMLNSYSIHAIGDGPTPRRLHREDLDPEEIRIRRSLLEAGGHLDLNEYASTSWRRPWTGTDYATWTKMRRFLKDNPGLFEESP